MRFLKVKSLYDMENGLGKKVLNSLDVYQSENFLLREFFWLRLKFLVMLMSHIKPKTDNVLDFGGGSGVMLPTLSKYFSEVHLIDCDTTEAAQVVAACSLVNTHLREVNVDSYDYPQNYFCTIVAADVLEHFMDLNLPISKLKSWLNNDGILFTSLPTENMTYKLLRLIFRKVKPIDHYHSAAEVEFALVRHGFKKIAGLSHPIFIPIFPLFRISAWKKF